MSPSKRDRDRARQRHERRVAYQREQARRRRDFSIGIAAVLAMALAVVLVIVLYDRSGQETSTPPPETTAPATQDTEPSPTPGDGQSTDPPPTQDPLPTTDPQLYDEVPSPELAENRTWRVRLLTNLGVIDMQLDGAAAPQAVANFIHLAREGFYDGTACHRLLPTSLLQCGDPTASGGGGPGYTFGPIENAPEDGVYLAGTVAMARVGNDPNSMGSQFFMVFNDVPLPSDTGGYSVFGTITVGLETLERIAADGTGDGERPAVDVIIDSVEIS